MKVGLGLWNFPVIAFSLEALLLFGGMFIYMRRTAASDPIGRFGPPVFGVVMAAIQAYLFFGPPPASANAAAVIALISYVIFAVTAQWLDQKRLLRQGYVK